MSPRGDKRAQLLAKAVDDLAEHGIADLSLAPMAERLGTSKRMLIYYFGSRDALIAEAIAASRPDVSDLFHDVRDTADLEKAAWVLWEAITRGRQRRPIRILFQVLSLAPTQPERYAALAADAVRAMVEPLVPVYRALGFGELEARSRASLLISGLRGLCQDRIVTGDDERIEAAADVLIRAAAAGENRKS
ncbi:TetR/AcrR family transcriptional regulator [Saccharopolyspora flava]|uniref:Transcriptional regulator, TetR family n=1 Tax=Saccharopolyspora flava TaxID=95161 RepID=A0A1I6P307_9PSEU|nr:TetR/AcrR family transcriptional regulator [Saccharopolyspora flava]SFS34545.1 transcriptional regulator, TetR family [Saccharopolyspora flava]